LKAALELSRDIRNGTVVLSGQSNMNAKDDNKKKNDEENEQKSDVQVIGHKKPKNTNKKKCCDPKQNRSMHAPPGEDGGQEQQAEEVAQHEDAGVFICGECGASFENKQQRGWHSRVTGHNLCHVRRLSKHFVQNWSDRENHLNAKREAVAKKEHSGLFFYLYDLIDHLPADLSSSTL